MTNIPEKMKAIIAYAPGDYRFEIVDTPRAAYVKLNYISS